MNESVSFSNCAMTNYCLAVPHPQKGLELGKKFVVEE